MNKKEARAVWVFCSQVEKMAEKLGLQLRDEERGHAEAYWLGHIKSIVRGYGYGSAPIRRALEILEDRAKE